METTEIPPMNRQSRQHLGVRMGQGFRDSVADLHDNKAMTYAKIAESFGFVDASPLTHILAGRRGVSHEKAAYIASVLGKSLEQLRETAE